MSPFSDVLFHLAFIEDLGFPFRDVTTDLLFSATSNIATAKIVSKHAETIAICGIELTRGLFSRLSDDVKIYSDYQDGDFLKPGETLLTIEAAAATLLQAERTVLNFLRHLSAVATLTSKYVARVKDTQLKILDTRKTTPGLRSLEKYAVQCGGGVNHRMGLYDAVMVKDTHIDILGGMEQALAILLKAETHNLPVVVEVRSIAELEIVLQTAAHKVTRVLLDNMSTDTLAACVKRCRGVIETEASGNIRLDTILSVAHTGVDYASVGELTYNAGHVDLSMYTSQAPV